MKNLLLITLAVSLFTFISCSVTLEKPEDGKKVEESVVDDNQDDDKPSGNSSEEVGDTKEDGTENPNKNIPNDGCWVWGKNGAFFKINPCTGFDDELKTEDESKQTPKVDETDTAMSETPTELEFELYANYAKDAKENIKVGSCVKYEGVINNPTGGEFDFQTSLKVESFDGTSGTIKEISLVNNAYSSETYEFTGLPIDDSSVEENDDCVLTEIEVVDITVKAGTFKDALYLKAICNGYVSELWLHGDVSEMIVKMTDTSIGFEEEVAKIGSGTDCDIEYVNEEDIFNSDETSVDDGENEEEQPSDNESESADFSDSPVDSNIVAEAKNVDEVSVE